MNKGGEVAPFLARSNKYLARHTNSSVLQDTIIRSRPQRGPDTWEHPKARHPNAYCRRASVIQTWSKTSRLAKRNTMEARSSGCALPVAQRRIEKIQKAKNSLMHDRNAFRMAPLLLLAFLLIAPATAAAKSASGSGPSHTLSTIVVTAQKRRQNANDVPMTLKVFTGKELAELGVTDPTDLALYTPALMVSASGGTGVPYYSIRGVGFQDYSTGSSSTVGLYFDGVAMPYAVMSGGPLFDLKRVEVLKGPQGDLYGENTTAGQINFVSNTPTNYLDSSILLGYSSYQTMRVEGYVSGPLMHGVDGRVAFTTTQSGEGWQRSLTRPTDRLGKKDVYAGRVMLNFDLGGHGNWLLKAEYDRNLSDNEANTAYNGQAIGLGQFPAPYVQILPYAASGNAPWYSTGDNTAADWSNFYTAPNGAITYIRPKKNEKLISLASTLTYRLNRSLTLTSVTGYYGFHRRDANDWAGVPGSPVSSNINTSDIKVYSEELRLSGTSRRLDWIAGLYWEHDRVNEIYHYFMPDSVYGQGAVVFGIMPFAAAPILTLRTRYHQETTSKAAFAHAGYKITNRLKISGGVRYTDAERSWSGCTYDSGDGSLANFLNFAFGASLAPGACGTINDIAGTPGYIFSVIGTPNVDEAFRVYTQAIDNSEWMGDVSPSYAITKEIMAYVRLAHGFKAGGFNGANSNTTSQLEAYKPEELNEYEIGLKSTLLHHRMQANVSAFYYDYRNKQDSSLAVTFVGNISGITNVPKSRIEGVESSVTWAPLTGLMAHADATWLGTRVLEWNPVSDASHWPTVIRFNAAGEQLPQAPKWEFNGYIRYQKPIGASLKAGIEFDAHYKGPTSGSALGIAYATAGYTVCDTRLTVGGIDGKWRVMLWSRNVFNKYYYPAAYGFANVPYVRTVGMPRTVGVTFQYHF